MIRNRLVKHGPCRNLYIANINGNSERKVSTLLTPYQFTERTTVFRSSIYSQFGYRKTGVSDTSDPIWRKGLLTYLLSYLSK